MSIDGSDFGISAERALKAVLGNEPPPDEEEEQTPEQVVARIKAATPDSYSGGTDCLTRAVLRLFEQREETQAWPTSVEYKFPQDYDGSDMSKVEKIGPDLYEAAKAVATPEELEAFDGCTGFMWGFAVNQARWIKGQHPGSNPALIEVKGLPE